MLELNKKYNVSVLKVLDKGLIVSIENSSDTAFIHISKLSYEYISDINEFAKIGDTFEALCVNGLGKLELSIKACTPNRYNKKAKNSVNPKQTSESPTDTLSIGSKNLEDMIASADAVLRDKLGNGIAEQRKRKLCRKDKHYG